MANVNVNVSVADDDADRFGDVVRRAEQAGRRVDQELGAAS
jgi:hypothetical protein